ncbi:hypothetical protein TVAG_370860 [Trichomonas vaginalis G3]|uniref:Uncharacterized protein n=1 Tax=Trichomonas vaginalis (strain ATCC PRA-98 / G3) TaxID=412133 RepID=A2FHN8_TRIV3|nr:hypothetical protein TVAGG3_0946580 [Trichomonas vaginalis G3]EAX95582.1 hypothetical protein TVAG_370860 [Trichomonas vaginalis G3]KAI5486918.1 hypothetical protein TVAGG3_0946580 [Trichomonas vaginalis G3]|eukprot:XP_001308512.1 hypothetical protein [Trichomonas vaginalis G3]
MISTADETPIYAELGLGPNPSKMDMATKVLKKSYHTFQNTALEFSLVYSGCLIINDLVDKKPIQWRNNIVTATTYSLNIATSLALAEIINDSIALHRGERKIYDSIIASTISGGIVEIPHGASAVYRGAVSGALWSSAMAGMQYVFSKFLSDKPDSENK